MGTPPAATPVTSAALALRFEAREVEVPVLGDITRAEMPLVQIHTEQEEQHTALSGTGLIKPHAAIKVLCVEDNLINQKIVCKQLKSRGYEVHAANHGVEALSALQAAVADGLGKYFDIVLCDIEMPVMDGIACAKEIRRLESVKALPGRIPVVAVTANARSTHVERAIDAGMVSFGLRSLRLSRC